MPSVKPELIKELNHLNKTIAINIVRKMGRSVPSDNPDFNYELLSTAEMVEGLIKSSTSKKGDRKAGKRKSSSKQSEQRSSSKQSEQRSSSKQSEQRSSSKQSEQRSSSKQGEQRPSSKQGEQRPNSSTQDLKKSNGTVDNAFYQEQSQPKKSHILLILLLGILAGLLTLFLYLNHTELIDILHNWFQS